MSMLQRLAGRVRSEHRGTVRVVDPNPLNWLYLTYNTVEEAVRVTKQGKIRPAAMSRYRWRDDRTLEITVRDSERFADGTRLDADSVRRAFDEQIRWASPHPPGTHVNIDRRTRAEVVDDRTVRLHRNDLTREQAIDLLCDTVGEVDIVTEVPPSAAERVRRSRHAQLIAVDAVRALAGVIDREADGLPLHDPRARRALNLAIDRHGLARGLFGGTARPLAGLTPPTPLTALHRAPDRLRPSRTT